MKMIVTSTSSKLEMPLTARVALRNLSDTDSIWIGHDANVSANDGFPLYAGEVYEFPVEQVQHGQLWLIADPGKTVDIRVLQVG